MAQSKQEIIDKILSFSFEELARWMENRLRGQDPYFSIYVGQDTNLRGFLHDAFKNIDQEQFRDNFSEVLKRLVNQVRSYTPGQIKKNREYIYELIALCGRIKTFEDKKTLFEIARSGKLKKVRIHGTDLHLVLLTTLSSYRVGGNYQFWLDQLGDSSNRHYANAIFYALLTNGFICKIFEKMDAFIDRFRGGIELELAVESLFDDHNPEDILERFRHIGDQLSPSQRKAIDGVLVEIGYGKIFVQPTQAVYCRNNDGKKFDFSNLKKPFDLTHRFAAT